MAPEDLGNSKKYRRHKRRRIIGVKAKLLKKEILMKN